MVIGVLYLLGACLCWSAVFVIPAGIKGFSSLEISLGRFFFFGLTSVCLILSKKRDLFQKIYGKVWKKAFGFGLLSTIVCYTFSVVCIRYAGSAMTALLFGTVPIVVALLGNFRRKEYPFRLFLFPCLAIGTGILLANKEAFSLGAETSISYTVGVLSGIAGVASWIWYVIACFDFMEKNEQIGSSEWVMAVGSAVFCQVIVLWGIVFLITGDVSKYCTFTSDLQGFLVGSIVLGVISSWLALYFWTQANLRLPISLVGQLAVAELVFGLALVYAVENRMPSWSEGSGVVLMIAGVLYGFRSLKKAETL